MLYLYIYIYIYIFLYISRAQCQCFDLLQLRFRTSSDKLVGHYCRQS